PADQHTQEPPERRKEIGIDLLPVRRILAAPDVEDDGRLPQPSQLAAVVPEALKKPRRGERKPDAGATHGARPLEASSHLLELAQQASAIRLTEAGLWLWRPHWPPHYQTIVGTGSLPWWREVKPLDHRFPRPSASSPMARTDACILRTLRSPFWIDEESP